MFRQTLIDLAIIAFIISVVHVAARADTPMTCEEQVVYLKDVVAQLGQIAEGYRVRAEDNNSPVIRPRMKTERVAVKTKTGGCRKDWYTRKDGKRKYRCR